MTSDLTTDEIGLLPYRILSVFRSDFIRLCFGCHCGVSAWYELELQMTRMTAMTRVLLHRGTVPASRQGKLQERGDGRSFRPLCGANASPTSQGHQLQRRRVRGRANALSSSPKKKEQIIDLLSFVHFSRS